MSEATAQDQIGVSETLPITLYLRAPETQRPDAPLRVEKAVALVNEIIQDQ